MGLGTFDCKGATQGKFRGDGTVLYLDGGGGYLPLCTPQRDITPKKVNVIVDQNKYLRLSFKKMKTKQKIPPSHSQ